MGFGENMYGEISSKSGSSVTYLPIMRPHQIEPASPIAVTRYPTSGMRTFHLAVALYPSSRTQRLV